MDKLLDHKLKFIKEEISLKTGELLINYIYDRWEKDRSWVGTVKPMKWFDYYFDFFSEKHSEFLLTIFDELLSSTPSFDALPYTQSVVRKIRPELLIPIESEFIGFCARRSISYPKERIEYLYQKLQELINSNLIKKSSNKSLAEKVLLLDKYHQEERYEDKKKIEEEINTIVYPDGK